MVKNNDNNDELRASVEKRASLRKYSKVARTSMLAITMGMSLHPAPSSAANTPEMSGRANQEISVAAPVQFKGNSLDYFKKVFLPKSSFYALNSGEQAPTAYNLSISGTAAVGQTLSGTYSYSDVDNDIESGTTFQWYRSDDAGQSINYVPILGATSSTYILTLDDANKFITFVVTPRTTVAPMEGEPAKSEPTAAVAAAPTASSVTITGTAKKGQTLTGTYVYNDANGNTESGTTVQWYRSDDAAREINYVPILGATSSSYTLTAEDVGKYMTFVVTPRTTVAPTDGVATKSAPTAAVANASSSSSPTTTADTTPTAAPEEESLIEVVAVKKNVETMDSAKLLLTKDKNGISLANFHFFTDGVVRSSQDANKKETIAVRAKALKGAKTVQADIGGDAISTLISNQQRLGVITGDVAIDFPTVSLPLNDIAKQKGTTADKLKVEIKIEKQPEAVKEQANVWAASQKASVIGEAFKFSLQVNDGTTSTTPAIQYGNKYAYQTVPIPAGVTNLNSLGAVMLLDGKYVAVPVRIVDSEHALIHTPTNATVMLIQRNEDFSDVDTHWGKDDIHLMADKGNVQGNEQGSYKPDQVLTRAEFADLLVKSFGLGHQGTEKNGPAFTDLPADPALQEQIRIAAGDGLFNGVTDDKFEPDQGVTREQMIAVLMRFYKEFELETGVSNAPPSYTDMSQMSGWAEADVLGANEAGIITGYEDDTIRPLRQGTRAEATALIRRFLQKTNLIN